MTSATAPTLGAWLRICPSDDARAQRAQGLGLLTGLKHDTARGFHHENLERALILDRLVETRHPRRVLEIGTGRGLGSMMLASAAKTHGSPIEIVTVDLYGPDVVQNWAIEVGGKQELAKTSRTDVWGKHLPEELTSKIRQETGYTSNVLPRLHKAGERFDLVFIDAGHDLASVVHDLTYATMMLSPGGAILMDDFSPMEDYGVGTCIAVAQARRIFRNVEVFATDGVVFGEKTSLATRGMAFLTDLRKGTLALKAGRLPFWRAAGWMLHRSFDARLFPLEVRR
jgi:predicted O-methyltransferase YrrM